MAIRQWAIHYPFGISLDLLVQGTPRVASGWNIYDPLSLSSHHARIFYSIPDVGSAICHSGTRVALVKPLHDRSLRLYVPYLHHIHLGTSNHARVALASSRLVDNHSCRNPGMAGNCGLVDSPFANN